MKAFLLIELTVTNIEIYSEYMDKVPAIIALYHGQYIVRSSKVWPHRGEWNPERIVMIGFENIDALRTCFNSPEYKALLPLLEQSTDSHSIIIEE